MRKIIFLIISTISLTSLAQDCLLQERTVSKDSGTISDIRNVRAEVLPWKNGYQKCVVTLDGLANGQWSQGRGEFVWDGQSSSKQACSAAVELAKKNLLNELKSSTISNESVVICREKPKEEQPLLNPKVGTILDNPNVLRVHPKFQNTFYHNGEECRWYIETGWNGKDILQFNGIVCRYGPKKWIIVDKF